MNVRAKLALTTGQVLNAPGGRISSSIPGFLPKNSFHCSSMPPGRRRNVSQPSLSSFKSVYPDSRITVAAAGAVCYGHAA